jgi:hypothetical protein
VLKELQGWKAAAVVEMQEMRDHIRKSDAVIETLRRCVEGLVKNGEGGKDTVSPGVKEANDNEERVGDSTDGKDDKREEEENKGAISNSDADFDYSKEFPVYDYSQKASHPEAPPPGLWEPQSFDTFFKDGS